MDIITTEQNFKIMLAQKMQFQDYGSIIRDNNSHQIKNTRRCTSRGIIFFSCVFKEELSYYYNFFAVDGGREE